MSKYDPLRLPDYLEHILEAIGRINLYLADTDQATFLNDQKTQDAVVRNFEIIGEAAHNIETHHAVFAAKHQEIPWSAIYAMRNRVAHGYFKVDLDMVWKTIRADLPELHTQIKELLEHIK